MLLVQPMRYMEQAPKKIGIIKLTPKKLQNNEWEIGRKKEKEKSSC